MKIFKKIFSGNTLYYPGCMTKFALLDHVKQYRKILKTEGIDYIMLKDKELCCGSPVKNAGLQKQFKDVAKQNLQIFRDHGIEKIISNCPSCVAIFKKDYPKLLGQQWNIEVLHITEIIDKSKKFLKKVENKKATYHDPCHLGRELGIYDKPREIIELAGYELVEMELNKEDSFCCGGGGGVRTNETELSDKIAIDRTEQAVRTGAEHFITCCPMCYAQLKNSSGDSIKMLELCDLFEV